MEAGAKAGEAAEEEALRLRTVERSAERVGSCFRVRAFLFVFHKCKHILAFAFWARPASAFALFHPPQPVGEGFDSSPPHTASIFPDSRPHVCGDLDPVQVWGTCQFWAGWLSFTSLSSYCFAGG